MLWRNMRLQSRMLVGYGLILFLITILGVLLMSHVIDLNSRVHRLGAEVNAEANTSTRLAVLVSAAQQAIDRYLQLPQDDNRLMATQALDNLSEVLVSSKAIFVSGPQREQVASIEEKLTAYRGLFQTLSPLIESQNKLQAQLSSELFDAQTLLGIIVAQRVQAGGSDTDTNAALVQAQEQMRRATYWSIRMISEQNPELFDDTMAELTAAEATLRSSRPLLDSASQQGVDTIFGNTLRATVALAQYRSNIRQVQRQRSVLLSVQGVELRQQAEALTSSALGRLTGATADLGQRSQQAQRLTGVALLLTLLIVLVFGVWLPRTISRPLIDLVKATRRIDAGDYRVLVRADDRSEVGQLATAFNQMTVALAQQRDKVLRQQEALNARNDELGQALLALQESIAEREQLATTVRALSVPVVPILRQVLLIPLVGELDAARAALLREQLLRGIEEAGARVVILDITGVPLVDARLVEWLVSATNAARLLGAECILVGIRPEVAQALVASGADLNALVTRANLRHAVEYSARAVHALGLG